MSSDPRAIRFWISAWLPVLIGIAVIVVESTVFFGADHTSGPLRWIYQALFGAVSDARWEVIHHYIRKTGHFTGYGLIGLAWLRAWRMTCPKLRLSADAALALVGTGLIASCDEWHQTFLPNRTGTPWDVLLDCCGASVMLLLALVYLYSANRIWPRWTGVSWHSHLCQTRPQPAPDHRAPGPRRRRAVSKGTDAEIS